MFEAFFTQKPSPYDLANFALLASLLIIVVSLHLRQMKHSREISKLQQDEQE